MPETSERAASRGWSEIILDGLKAQDIGLAVYVPDNVLLPLLAGIDDEPSMTAFVVAREEEAIGIATGAWLGGVKSVVLMQTSGFATLTNALASLVVPYQIPLVMIISERGTLGEFNPGQALVCRTLRPALEALGIEYHTLTRLDEVGFIVQKSIEQAVKTQAPVALILSPLLTRGQA